MKKTQTARYTLFYFAYTEILETNTKIFYREFLLVQLIDPMFRPGLNKLPEQFGFYARHKYDR